MNTLYISITRNSNIIDMYTRLFDSCEPCSPKGDRFVDTSLSTLISHHEAFRRQAVRYHSAGIVEFNGAYSFNGISAKSRHPVFLPEVHKKAMSPLTISLTAIRPAIPSYDIQGCIYIYICVCVCTR